MLEDEEWASTALAEIDARTARDRTSAQANMWSNLAGLMNGGNKQLFKIGKTAALAKAAYELPSAVLSSYEKAGGYPWGIGPALAMAAAGMQQISAISSASFGGGGGGAGSVGGGAVAMTPASAPVTGQLPPPPAGSESDRRDVSVVVSGGLESDETMRILAERLEEIREDMGGNPRFSFV